MRGIGQELHEDGIKLRKELRRLRNRTPEQVERDRAEWAERDRQKAMRNLRSFCVLALVIASPFVLAYLLSVFASG